MHIWQSSVTGIETQVWFEKYSNDTQPCFRWTLHRWVITELNRLGQSCGTNFGWRQRKGNIPASLISFSMIFSDPDEFDRIYEPLDVKSKKIHIVDSGLTYNLPYPLILRPQRGVDLIISFDFSARPSDSSPPFKVRVWLFLQSWIAFKKRSVQAGDHEHFFFWFVNVCDRSSCWQKSGLEWTSSRSPRSTPKSSTARAWRNATSSNQKKEKRTARLSSTLSWSTSTSEHSRHPVSMCICGGFHSLCEKENMPVLFVLL